MRGNGGATWHSIGCTTIKETSTIKLILLKNGRWKYVHKWESNQCRTIAKEVSRLEGGQPGSGNESSYPLGDPLFFEI